MRYVWSTFFGLLLGLLAFAGWHKLHGPPAPDAEATTALAPTRTVADTVPGPVAPLPTPADARPLPLADSLIRFARQQLGAPYTYAGTTPTGGFDCSGFLLYVYGHVGVAVPHSTALLINTGRPIPREQARPGDMVIFTGTATTSTTAGHAGIVLSEPGEPLLFIHSSSARRKSGVKISQVEGTDYERRFLGIRRVLGPGADSQPQSAGQISAPVKALTPKTPTVASALVVPVPRVHRYVARRHKVKTTVKAKAKPKARTTPAKPRPVVRKKAVAKKRVAAPRK